MRLLLSLLLLLPPAAPRAETGGAPAAKPRKISPWVALLPGGGQYLLRQDARAATYAAGTLSLFGWGIRADRERFSGDLNAPWVYAQQVYVCSIYEAYRDARVLVGQGGGSAPVDPTPVERLAKAPFRPKYLADPWVFGAALAGAGVNLALTRADKDRRGFGSVSRIGYLGDSFNKEWGSAAYAAYWIPLSLGAGVAEESLFRGMLQSDMENRWGPRPALLGTSGLFGLAHLKRLNDASSWADVGFAALGGLYLGWRCQENGYRLSESVAAHTWFDIAAGLAVFFADPKENPLGAKVNFSF